MRASLSALLSLTLMIAGCSSAAHVGQEASKQTSVPKKASPTPPAKSEQVLLYQPPGLAQRAAGLGAPSPPRTETACPDVPEAVYAAIEKPTPVPTAGEPITPDRTKKWIGNLEDQVKGLQQHLREEAQVRQKCRAAARVEPVPR